MVSACRAQMTPAPMTAKRIPSLLSGAWWSAIIDTLRVQQPSERLGGTSEQFDAAKASGQMTAAKVRLHREESVEAIGFESLESLGTYSTYGRSIPYASVKGCTAHCTKLAESQA